MKKPISQEVTPTVPKTWPFIDSRTLRRDHFNGGKFVEARLREKLPSPLYWIKPDRKVLWNVNLVRDYLLNGDGPNHQRLAEAYLSTLPGQQSA